ncbi:hypothetical protein ACFOZ0_35565 [Streptomyces yaanensis]|uniref:Uncharacterized protein n=1 Tax=Streptomyces yaanensis TaxID=1142239 RepID=A0ABV7SQW4_9ACTN|nr:hypothetical protein [Streptomyces sp. CGMCC 4.7035]WNB97199.1 hypothetical protein Q2K21_03440 [Streptomyces sp. CGMCC 4.7035]
MPPPDVLAAVQGAEPAYGFLWLAASQAWYTFLWVSLLVTAAVLWRATRARPVLRVLLTACAALGVTLVAPALYIVVGRFADSNTAGSDMAMAIFSIVATVVSGYSLYVATVVDRKRDEVEKNLRDLTTLIGELRAQNQQQRTDLENTRTQLALQDLRIALFLTVTDEIETLDEDGSALSRNRAMTLRLVQRLLARQALAEIVFDLRELTSVLHRRPTMVSTEVKARIRSYLDMLIRCSGASDIEHVPFIRELSQRLGG